jgi:hypothetical protein
MGAANPELARMIDTNELSSWRRWGPYLSDRQWGTVREDYSDKADPWNYFPFWDAHKRAYRWGEDGIAGISDDNQYLCLSLALWNGQDPILKERFYGLPNEGGNHGEDVKELYYHLDATPTHSYLKMLYKYPHRRYPYEQLQHEGKNRSRLVPEFELLDTGVFNDNRYFDVFVEYAKAGPRDILMRITAHNRGPEAAELHILPQLWFRNTWSWKLDQPKPAIMHSSHGGLKLFHPEWDAYRFWAGGATRGGDQFHSGIPSMTRLGYMFCENETNTRELYNTNATGPFKDGFHDAVIRNNRNAISTESGTKATAHYKFNIPAGESVVVRCRLRHASDGPDDPFVEFEETFAKRIAEADIAFAEFQKEIPSADARMVQRQAVAGLIWTKQFFHYDVYRWLKGDSAQPPPAEHRWYGRNSDWQHFKANDIISMPDKWEYPWFAAWDLAFHAVAFAPFDPEFAKEQLLLLCREWYMHPNGQLSAYEWNFGDTNPPVHAWAAWRVFQIDRKFRHMHRTGGHIQHGHHNEDASDADWGFLERVFHKLMMNFTWWVNKKDSQGRNVFQGGFLGLDNIGVFDRSHPLPTGGFINQADGTAWMAMYSLNLMRMALELATRNRAYEDIAIKFFEHFLSIAKAMTDMGGKGVGLWDEEDGFYYDELTLPDNRVVPLKVRSMVGLIPLFAVEVLEPELLAQMPAFATRLRWVLENRADLAGLVSRWFEPGRGERRLLSLLRGHRMKKLMLRLLDENEFLSPYGIRGLSRYHRDHPYTLHIGGTTVSVSYVPGDSDTGMFGGNSNWRGPVWFPVNFLIIESLQKFHHYYGTDFEIEYPVGSGQKITILEAAIEITRRLTRLFLKDSNGRRACFGSDEKMQSDPHFRDYLLFHEYFHGDTGRGIGANHQTGWTALVAKLLNPRRGEKLYDDTNTPEATSGAPAGVSVGKSARTGQQ